MDPVTPHLGRKPSATEALMRAVQRQYEPKQNRVSKADPTRNPLHPRRQGRPSALQEIEPAKFQQMLKVIQSGVTPYVAAQAVCMIHPSMHYRWMKVGRVAEDPEQLEVLYYNAVMQAQMAARSAAEEVVHVTDPATWLRVGPAGRDKGPEEPGWVDESRVKHTDPTGEAPPRFILEFTTSGAKTKEVAVVGDSVPEVPQPSDPAAGRRPGDVEVSVRPPRG
jgi:hypothetical protein